jgi:hypothetical protein
LSGAAPGDEAAGAVAEQDVEGAGLARGGGGAGDDEVGGAVEVEIRGREGDGGAVEVERGGAGEAAAAVVEGEDERRAARAGGDQGEVERAVAVKVGERRVRGGAWEGRRRDFAQAQAVASLGAEHRRQRLLQRGPDRWNTCT